MVVEMRREYQKKEREVEEKNKTNTEFVEEKRWEGDGLEVAGANKKLGCASQSRDIQKTKRDKDIYS